MKQNSKEPRLIYITAPDKSTASEIASQLIKEKLAACVNILGKIESFYNWNGELTQSEEVLILAKTTKDLEILTFNKVKELHPYDSPCILSFNINNGDSSFLNWITNNTLSTDNN